MEYKKRLNLVVVKKSTEFELWFVEEIDLLFLKSLTGALHNTPLRFDPT